MDESYCPFVELYRGSGKPVINEDFADAWWQWKLLDFEQKRMRIDRLKSNLDNQLYSDPTYIPMPRKFIEREWKRELRPQPKARTVEHEPELVNIDPAEAARRSVIEYQQFIRDRDRDRKQQAAS